MYRNNNIAIIAGTLGQGGAERQLVYILKAMLQMGFRPRVFSLTSGEHFEDEIRGLGVELINITESGRIARMRSIAVKMRVFSPAVVMSMHFFTNLYAHAAAKYCHIPSIGALRSDCFSEVQDAGKLGKLSLKSPHVIAANSRKAITNAVSMGRRPDSLFWLPNIVDTDMYAPDSDLRLPGPLCIVLAGRLEQAKRTDRFLRLLSRLVKELDIEAKIYGKGTLEPDLRQQAESLNLHEPQLSFEGLVNNMLHVYRQADMLISTSDYEGTPNVILEAQSCGLPVIATSVGGVPDIVEHGKTGILVEAEDEEGLFAETLSLLHDEQKRRALGVQAREYALREYSISNLAVKLTALFNAVGIGPADSKSNYKQDA